MPEGAEARFAGFRAQFAERGFCGPLRVLTPRASRRLLRRLERAPAAKDWHKGQAAASRIFYAAAVQRSILDRVEALLGGDFILWGARLARRRPGQVHPWHTDIETSVDAARSVSVWIGLENTGRNSSLHFVEGSHRFGRPVQLCAAEAGVTRDQVSEAQVAQWAHGFDPPGRVVRLESTDGEATFFDGRLWHGSAHAGIRGTRTALVLNYATPDTRIRIPDFDRLDWPFRVLETPRPPCVVVRGRVASAVNELVTPPTDGAVRPSLGVTPLRLPLAEDAETGWKIHPLFRGTTPVLRKLGCHASVLSPGKTPHEPHTHDDEELVIMLSGEAELVLVDSGDAPGPRTHALRPGAFAYYATNQRHTIRNASDVPAAYLLFKWHDDPAPHEEPLLATGLHDFEAAAAGPTSRSANGWDRWRILHGPTRYLRLLHCHLSHLAPGAGYEPHVDAHDVAILVLEGSLETVGQRAGPHDVIFYPAGEVHGMRNVGDTSARYLVFEFHPGEAGPRFAGASVRDLWPALLRLKSAVYRRLPGPLQRMVRRLGTALRR